MKVTMLSHTPDALDLLLKTKGTRLAHHDDPSTWSDEKKQEHLEYMRDTIKSSWEFVDYVFKIEGVTRAFTHQLVRTRTGSYAQEAMRVIDARDAEIIEPDAVAASGSASQRWLDAVTEIRSAYSVMIDSGIAPQDARGILPTNVTTSIIAKFNLRSLHEMAKLRLCTRTQGEYQDVFRAMRALVIGVHPWADEFIDVYCAQHGSCAFPRYGKAECPIYKHTAHDAMEAARVAVRNVIWIEGVRHEAAPVAKEGKAM